MPAGQSGSFGGLREVAVERPFVNLGERVVQGTPIAEGFMKGGVGDVQELLTPRHGDVEQATLVLYSSPVAALFGNGRGWKDVPHASPTLRLAGEAILDHGRKKHHRPLHALRLVNGHDPDRVG